MKGQPSKRTSITLWMLLATFELSSTACGGESVTDRYRGADNAEVGGAESAAAGATSSAGGTDGAAGDGASGAGDDADVTPAGFPRCGVLDPERADDCDGIDQITPFEPEVSSNVDGSIQVGELAVISVWVRNDGDTIRNKICVGEAVDTAGIVLSGYDDGTNPAPIGELGAGQTGLALPAYFQVRDAEVGSIARFTSWTTYEGTNCLGPTVTVEALVREYP